MPATTRTALKNNFKTGLVPTEEHFANLIDSALNPAEDNLTKEANGPLCIGYTGTGGTFQKVVEFFRGAVGVGDATWSIGLSVAAGRPGFSVFQGATPRLFISEEGNVGIGISTPSYPLHVLGNAMFQGTAQINGQVVMNSNATVTGVLSVDGNRLVVRADGNVGIGTSNPSHALEVRKDINGWLAQFQNLNAGGGSVHMAHADGRGMQIDAGSDLAATGQVLNVLSGNTSRLCVRTDGNVGIGTSNPGHALEVRKDINGWLAQFQNTNPGGGSVHLAHGAGIGAHINAGTDASESTYALEVVSNGVSRLRVIGDGKVGIGAESPTEKLDIRGNVIIPEGNLHLGESHNPHKSDTIFTFWNRGPGDPTYDTPRYEGDDRDFMRINKLQVYQGGGAQSTLFIINKYGRVGIGTPDPGSDKLDVRGRAYAQGGWQTTNADFAELFESENGTEIPSGTSVVFTKNGTVRKAKKNEAPIGVVTRNPAMLCNQFKEWPKMHLKDEFGQVLQTESEEEIIQPDGSKKTVKSRKPVLNPEYDPGKEYVPRDQRPEWHPVGLLGQLHLRKGQPVAPTWVKIRDVSENVELWLVK